MAVDDGDWSVFFDPGDWGRSATYVGGAPVVTRALPGILRAAHEEAAPADGWPGVSTVAPVYSCRAADLPPGAGAGDGFTLDGATYEVRDIQPDGTGLARLILERT